MEETNMTKTKSKFTGSPTTAVVWGGVCIYACLLRGQRNRLPGPLASWFLPDSQIPDATLPGLYPEAFMTPAATGEGAHSMAWDIIPDVP